MPAVGVAEPRRGTDSAGRASYTWIPTSPGFYRWRVTVASTPQYAKQRQRGLPLVGERLIWRDNRQEIRHRYGFEEAAHRTSVKVAKGPSP